jgi:glucose/arabinose dehydrogenase
MKITKVTTKPATFARPAALAACLVCALAGTAAAQVQDGPHTVMMRRVASGLVAPVQAKSPDDGSGRLFIVDQAGKIRILAGGVLLPTPFLDVTSIMVPVRPGYDERGLLGLAFHPNYAQNGRFFVHYTIRRTGQPGEPCTNDPNFGCSSEVIAEYRVSTGDPNIADPSSAVVLLTVQKPQFNHAGGGLDFGPDGMLYIAFGDGGGANDGLSDNPPSHGPGGYAQNTAVALGKVLRYDVSTPGTLTVPPSNPFFGQAGRFQGIFAYGFRNPYSMSFDDGPGGTGSLFVGDAGQNLFEEVDIVTSGGNYQWPIREGLHCFDPFNPNTPLPTCAPDGTPPITEYAHDSGIAVIGGKVYRGQRNPSLQGLYIFGDFSTSFGAANGHLLILDPAAPAPVTTMKIKFPSGSSQMGLYVKGLGCDSDNEMYVLTSTVLGPTGAGGSVWRLDCPADFNGDGTNDFFDYLDFVAAFDAQLPSSDYNLNGTIDFFDYLDFASAFEAGC